MFLDLRFQPSQRAQEASRHDTAWELMRKVGAMPKYHPTNRPDGISDLSGATNTLMQDWLDNYLNSTPPLQTSQTLSYTSSLFGSDDLLRAAAGFFNEFFNPSEPVVPSNIIAANGVTSLIDLVAWTLCDPGEAFLVLTPSFYMVGTDLALRAGISTVPVSTTFLPDPFDAAATPHLIRALDAATDGAARRRGLRCRALFICNPANPQGRCYKPETLAALASWCTRRDMHLVVDEIYGLSAFEADPLRALTSVDKVETRPGDLGPSPFTSILSLPFAGGRPPQNIHCLYSLSKDFGMGGLRMGFLITRNSTVRSALSKATWFTWLTAFSDSFATRLLRQIDVLHDYTALYRSRLTAAYLRAAGALHQLEIPFTPADAGLFVVIDLSGWLGYFSREEEELGSRSVTPELQLCGWLISHGVFLNPGQYAGYDIPGHFRLVFSGDPDITLMGIQRIRTSLDKLGPRMLETALL